MRFIDETKHCIFFLRLHAYFLRDFFLVAISEAATITSLCSVSMCILFVEDAFSQDLLFGIQPVLPVFDYMIFFAQSSFQVRQDFVVMFIKKLYLPFSCHSVQLLEILLVKLYLNLIDCKLLTHLLISLLEDLVFLVFGVNVFGEFGVFYRQITDSFAELCEHKLQVGCEIGGISVFRLVFDVIASHFLLQFVLQFCLLCPCLFVGMRTNQ